MARIGELTQCISTRSERLGGLAQCRLRLVAAIEHNHARRAHPVGLRRLFQGRRTEIQRGFELLAVSLKPCPDDFQCASLDTRDQADFLSLVEYGLEKFPGGKDLAIALIAVSEEVPTLMLDDLAEFLPANFRLLFIGKAVRIALAPRIVVQPVNQPLEQ